MKASWSVRLKVIVLESPPVDVPVMVTVKIPVVAVELAETVSVDVTDPLAGGITGLGLNVVVTPLGRPAVLRATASLKPPVEVTVTVTVPLVPWTMVMEVGLLERLKFG